MFFFTGVEIVGHSRLRGIRGWKVPHSEFSPFGVVSQSGLSLFCFESHSVLSLFYVESHSEFSQFGVESLSVLCLFYVESCSEFSPFWVQSVLSSVCSEFSPFWVKSIWGWVHSRWVHLELSPLGVEFLGVGSIRGRVHSGFSPIWSSVHSDKSPFLDSVVLGSVGESPISSYRAVSTVLLKLC